MIAITGASGNLGQFTLSYALEKIPADQLMAVVRTPSKLKNFAKRGVTVRAADYGNGPSLLSAFQGVDTLLLISTSAVGPKALHQEQQAVASAAEAGVRRIVYTSTLSPSPEAYFEAGRTCYATEHAIEVSGMDYVFFRNSMYLETIPLFIGSAMEDGQIYYPAGEGRVSFASRKDMAEALAVVLASDAHRSVSYRITGAEALRFADLAELLKSERMLPAAYHDISPTAFAAGLREANLPDDSIAFMESMAKSIRGGEFAIVDDCLAQLLSRIPLSAREYIAEVGK